MPESTASLQTMEDIHRQELLNCVYDGDFADVHAEIQEALKDRIFDPEDGLTRNEECRRSYERARFLSERFPAHKGTTPDYRRIFALLEWSAVGDCTTATILVIHYTLATGTLLRHSEDRTDLDDYLDELTSMRSVGLYLATEMGYGNNLSALQTEAVYDETTDEFVVTTPTPAAQKFMPNTALTDRPKIAIVMARLKVAGKDHGVFPFLVRISDNSGLCPGVQAVPIPEKTSLALDNGLTAFDGVRVPRRNLLGGTFGQVGVDGIFTSDVSSHRARFKKSISALVAGRVGNPATALACARASVHIALRYAMRRTTFGVGEHAEVPILAYRSHQLPLFKCLASTYAMTFLMNHVKRRFCESPDDVTPETELLIAVTKSLAGWVASDVIHICRERCGAQGMLAVNRIADYVGVAQAAVTAEGDSLVLLATVAGQMLTASTLSDGQGAAASRPEPAADLTDPDLLAALLHHRAHAMRAEARNAMSSAVARGERGMASWNATAQPALAMAKAHGAAAAMDLFIEQIARVRSKEVRHALRSLAALYGLSEVADDAGWFASRKVLTAEQVWQLDPAQDSLCEDIVPQVGLLIDGFGLSNQALRAPIAERDYMSLFDGREHGRQARERLGVAKAVRANACEMWEG
ncbi:acyl-CoA dehydrogenase family protein [Streptomyces chartreusis]|uniref:acyl-CoA dehydrogenase family protein n=1 Tax=Streptomyces chartreusis TaxID=1969 RepID=UPI00381A936B